MIFQVAQAGEGLFCTLLRQPKLVVLVLPLGLARVVLVRVVEPEVTNPASQHNSSQLQFSRCRNFASKLPYIWSFQTAFICDHISAENHTDQSTASHFTDGKETFASSHSRMFSQNVSPYLVSQQELNLSMFIVSEDSGI